MGINLYQHATAEDLDACEKLMDTAHLVTESMGGRTILHVESMHGSKKDVLQILKNSGSKDLLVAVDSNQETALHLAAYYKHTEVVEVLIDEAKRLFSSADFNSFLRKTNGRKNTALHLAVTNHNVKVVKLLVEADPNAIHVQNREGDSPIYLAAKRGYSDIVKLICKVCKSPSFYGRKGRTALHAAIKRLHEAKKEDSDVVEVLLATAKDMFGYHNRYEEFVGQADEKDGETALHLAVRGNHLAVVNLILQVAGSHKTKRNRDYKTPLYIAAEKGYNDIVRLFCNESKFENTLGPRGQTVLHAAVIGRDPACVRHILEREKRLVTYGDEWGWTPLHYAAYYKFDSILDVIVEAQDSVFYQSVYGDKVPTPLCVAAKEGHTSTVIQLMVNLLPPSSCTAVNSDGQNILHIAAGQSDKEMIQCILKHCPGDYLDRILNYKDVNGDTPLHVLIREGCFVPELIKHKKVDIMAKNYHNWTPLDMLYFQDYVVRDQLQIKKALHDIQTNQRKSYIDESLVPPSRRSKKDAGFRRAKENLMKKGLELYKERTSTQIIVTALITTVTFTVGFTVPGGLNQSGQQDEGLVLLAKKTAFRAFMVSDALALLLSTTSLFLYFISSMYGDPRQVSKLNHASTGLNIFSVIAMMLTFITGTYVVLSNSAALAITVSVIGCVFFLIVIVLLIKMFHDRRNVENFEV